MIPSNPPVLFQIDSCPSVVGFILLTTGVFTLLLVLHRQFYIIICVASLSAGSPLPNKSAAYNVARFIANVSL